MTDRPNVLPEWANSDVVETPPNEGGKQFPNKAEPPQALKDSGLLFEQGVAREFYNYQFDLINQWLTFLDANFTQIGMPIMVDLIANPTYTPPTGWVVSGTIQAAGGSLYTVYKRTT